MQIDIIRAMLEKARDTLNATEINITNYTQEEVETLNSASTVAWWAIRDAITGLDTIRAEARAEALREAADRAFAFHDKNDGMTDLSHEEYGIALRAAITQEPDK